MKKTLIWTILVLAVALGGLVWVKAGTLSSQVPIGILTANPDTVFTNNSTVVTITCELTDPRVIPASVNLQQIDSAGNVLQVVGTMTRDAAHPTFYAMQLTINAPTPQVFNYRVSAGYTGVLQRQYSLPLTITVTSLQTSTWLAYVTRSGYRFKYPSNWIVVEADDGTVTISTPNHFQTIPIEGAADITITYETNPSNLSMNQYFNGDFGPDLYTGTSNIISVTVASILSSRFVGGLTAAPGDKTIVIPVTKAFIVVDTSIPDDILNLFLNTITVP